MSIDQIHVSSANETKVNLIYAMPDKSTCKETFQANAVESIFKSSQCSNATSVKLQPASDAGAGSHSVAIHSIKFNCASSSSTSGSSGLLGGILKAREETDTCWDFSPSTSMREIPPPRTSPAVETFPTTTSTSASLTSLIGTGFIPSRTNVPSSPVVLRTKKASTISSASSTLESTTEKTIASSRNIVAATVPISTNACQATAAPTIDVPAALPKCLHQWLNMTDCKGNTDSFCYCKDSEFISKVMGCINSNSDSSSQASSAASYLRGICAEYVSQNPAIITAGPSTTAPITLPTALNSNIEASDCFVSETPQHSTITLFSTQEVTITSCAATVTNCPAHSTIVKTTSFAYATTVTAAAPSPVASVEFTTITYSSSFTAAATYSSGVSAGATVPGSTVTTVVHTTVTVPKVHFTTITMRLSATTSTVFAGIAPQPYKTEVIAATSPIITSAAPYPTTQHSAKFGPGPTKGIAGPKNATSFALSFAPLSTATHSPIVPYNSDAGNSIVPGLIELVAAVLAVALGFAL